MPFKDRMITLAGQERYEEAAALRDNIQAISSLNLSSNIDLANELDLDIFAIVNGDERGVIVKLFMRKGRSSLLHILTSDIHIFLMKMKPTNKHSWSFIHLDTPNIV